MHGQYVDLDSGKHYNFEQPRWRGDSGGVISLVPLPGISRSDIDSSQRSLWRYKAALPEPWPEPISLGEGCTPLVEACFHGLNVYFKLDWISPTGSFKDRGSTVLISYLKAQGLTRILEDSSGNGGASIAAYCARAGMLAKILVPASTQSAKISQIRALGAEVSLVHGSREDTARAAMHLAEYIFYGSHNWHPLFLQGTKTTAYELWEHFGFGVPDNIVVPAGAGSNVLGCFIGFGELLRAGEISRLPRLFAVQPHNCAPLYRAFANPNDDFDTPYPSQPTIAEGAAISHPIRTVEILAAVRRSGGVVTSVEETDIRSSLLALAELGFFVEPTAAVAAAGFLKLVQAGSIDARSRTVILLTGTGLKAISRWEEIMSHRDPARTN